MAGLHTSGPFDGRGNALPHAGSGKPKMRFIVLESVITLERSCGFAMPICPQDHRWNGKRPSKKLPPSFEHLKPVWSCSPGGAILIVITAILGS
jgi:hypothetical protein